MAALAAADLLLGAKLVVLGWRDEPMSSQPAARPAPLAMSLAGIAGQRPAEAYSDILAHPVFHRSREPFVPPPPAPPPAPVIPPPVVAVDPGLAVGGVMINRGKSKAFLLSRSGAGGMWVDERDTFQGWQVKSIDAAGVRIEQGGRAIELQLYPRN
ncbi:hypothetical protein [Bradyrhizobium sp. HKCCYLS20291]|uniref:hypothetical protein n=1 Tax=Bradyrhizobium sp. HKCCYLS20291 TaxID=3420766 RepID=UPI003EBD0D7E